MTEEADKQFCRMQWCNVIWKELLGLVRCYCYARCVGEMMRIALFSSRYINTHRDALAANTNNRPGLAQELHRMTDAVQSKCHDDQLLSIHEHQHTILSTWIQLWNTDNVFTAQCTLVQSAVLRSHVARPSVCNVGGLWSYRLEILETNCTDNYPNTFALYSQKAIDLLPGEHGEILGRLEME